MHHNINHREELPDLLSDVYRPAFQNGPIGVELGVAKGEFSKHIIQKYNFSQFYMIDWWRKPTHIDNYLKLLNFTHKNTQIFVLRGAFEEFVDKFDNGFFDFIYIDGIAGTGQMDGNTIRDWLPKIKQDGVFAGHDYCDKYPKTKHYVDLIAKEKNMQVNIIPETGRKRQPSWFYTNK